MFGTLRATISSNKFRDKETFAPRATRKFSTKHRLDSGTSAGSSFVPEAMPITYQIDPARRWLEIKLSGEVTVEEAGQTVRRLFADPDYSDELSGIIDIREMTNVWNVTDLRGLAEMQLARPGPSWSSRRGVVVSSPAHYGTARVFTVFSEPGPVQYNVFYNLEAALAWVRE